MIPLEKAVFWLMQLRKEYEALGDMTAVETLNTAIVLMRAESLNLGVRVNMTELHIKLLGP